MQTTSSHTAESGGFWPSRRWVFVALFAWTLLTVVFLFMEWKTHNNHVFEVARSEARIAHAQDIVYREWNSRMGGVYVPITEQTPPNPYLPPAEREITTPSGKKLTKINPAYMTRLVHEMLHSQSGIYSHITSLKPLRPENAPDAWEITALQAFERGQEEVSSVEILNGRPHIRLMRPLVTTASCLKCHAAQGYREGDIRGGISVAVPMEPLLASMGPERRKELLFHGGIWLMGIICLWAGGGAILRKQRQLRRSQTELRQQLVLANHFALEAKKANQIKTDFLANMSHELRTPLNIIMGFSEILADNIRDPEQTHHLDMIRTSSRQLLDLVSDVLDISRIERGKLELDAYSFSLVSLVEELIAQFSKTAAEKGLSLTAEVDPAIPNLLVGDDRRLCQILTNLLNNAVKFTSAGYVRLRAEAIAESEKTVDIRFTVADSGIGIPPDKQNMIFEAFTQVDASITRKYGGTGLGLTIVRSLAERMHGRVWLESQPGHGSVFYCTVQLQKGMDMSSDYRNTDATGPSACSPPANATSVRVLLVEDDKSCQKLSQCILTKAGFAVELAENGKQALEKIRQGRFNLVLMDMQMPQMDGLAATREIRKLGLRDLPILGLTANAFASDRQRCLDAGMNDWITKPVSPKAMLEKINEWLAAKPVPAASS